MRKTDENCHFSCFRNIMSSQRRRKRRARNTPCPCTSCVVQGLVQPVSHTTVRRHRALENEAKSQPELINIVSLDDGGSENEGEVELDGVREDYFDDMVLLQPEGKQSKYTIDMCNIDNATKLASKLQLIRRRSGVSNAGFECIFEALREHDFLRKADNHALPRITTWSLEKLLELQSQAQAPIVYMFCDFKKPLNRSTGVQEGKREADGRVEHTHIFSLADADDAQCPYCNKLKGESKVFEYFEVSGCIKRWLSSEYTARLLLSPFGSGDGQI